jgi:molybdate transport system substrate-binding protein
MTRCRIVDMMRQNRGRAAQHGRQAGGMSMMVRFARAAAVGAAALLASLTDVAVGAANAAEIKVLSTVALKAALDEELLPQFAKAAENKVVIKYGAAAALKQQIEGGETFDVAILTPAAVDDLIKQGKIVTGSRTNVARTGVGVAIRQGAAKPDISTVEAFKRTLLDAKSIAYGDPALGGASSIYFAGVLQRLGIAEAVKGKTKLTAAGESAQPVAAGEAELGVGQISEIVPVRGAELLGPFPGELQVYTAFTAGTAVSAKDAAAANALIKFLTNPAAAQIFKQRGLEPS